MVSMEQKPRGPSHLTNIRGTRAWLLSKVKTRMRVQSGPVTAREGTIVEIMVQDQHLRNISGLNLLSRLLRVSPLVDHTLTR